MKRIFFFLGAAGLLCFQLTNIAGALAAPVAISSVNITGGTQSGFWGTSSSILSFTDFGPNTNLVGGYIGSSGIAYPNSSSFAPSDSIAVIGDVTYNYGFVYTAAANLGDSATSAGILAGGSVPTGVIDPVAGTIQMDLSSWFYNTGNEDFSQGVPNATGTASCVGNNCTFQLVWQKAETNGQFQGHIGYWTVSGTATTVVPIPSAVWLFFSGLAGIAAFIRRR
jgi:hypothetical protein